MGIQKNRLLWDPEDPPSVNQPTSIAAAKKVKPTVSVKEYRVLCFIRSCGKKGATDEEIQIALGMPGNTERPRRIKLLELRTIYQSAERRPTRSGNRAIVWRAFYQ